MRSALSTDLAAMPAGCPGRITSVEAGSDDTGRLEQLGLCAGRTVEVVQPGDPMIVRVLGTRIGLAAVLARAVQVELECVR